MRPVVKMSLVCLLIAAVTLAAPAAATKPAAVKVPQVDIPHAVATMKALGAAIRKGMIRACHDLSEGGLVVAAAEMSLASLLGRLTPPGFPAPPPLSADAAVCRTAIPPSPRP